MVKGDDKRKRSYDSDNELPESECDAPRPWGVYFQDSGTPQMEALVELHDNIVFYLIIILFGVGWLLVTIMNKFGNMASPLSQRFTSHGTTIEIIW
jgi:heme/copper-type cytochrome/quinol oxidase subunit 2